MRRLALALAAAVLATLAAPLTTPVAAAEPEPAVDPGTLLPQRPLDFTVVPSVVSASREHVIMRYPSSPAPGELATGTGTYDLLRLVDGAVVRRDVAGGEVDTRNLPQLGATTTHQVVATPAGATTTSVVWRSIATGEVVDTLSVPRDELVHALEDGVLLARAGGRQLWVVDRGGEERQVAGLADQVWELEGASPGTLLVRQGFTTYEVDLATASATVLVDGVLPAETWATPERLYWTETVYGTGKRLHWRDRRDGTTGQLQTTTYLDMFPLGDGVGTSQFVPDTSGYEIKPLDLATGQLLPALPGLFTGLRPAGGGRVAAVDLTGTGTMVLLGGDPEPVVELFALPLVARTPVDVVLTSTSVVADWSAQQWVGHPVPPELASWSPGQQEWQPLTSSLATSSLVTASGDVLVTRTADEQGRSTSLATWPGGSRVLATGTSPLDLGRGGLTYRVDGSGDVRDVRSGVVLRTVPVTTPTSLDDSWVWTREPGGVLQGVDTASGSTRTVADGVDCAGNAQVRGRFALVHCHDEHLNVFAVDLDGAVPPVRLPLAPADCFPQWRCNVPVQLGDGFAVWTDDDGVVRVADLSGNGVVRGYGYGGDPAIGDGRSGRLAFRGAEGIRLVDLGWLGTAPSPTPDTTPPVVGTLGGPAPTGIGARFALTWSATDPAVVGGRASGVASSDLRYQQSPSASAPFGPWVEPAGLTGTTLTSAELDVPPGSTTCAQVRVRDRAGNVSAWSASRCYSRASATATALVLAGDLTGDGPSDLLTRDEAGTLWLHRGEPMWTFAAPTPVSSGWRGLTALVAPGDVTGDRRADLLGRDSSGRMWLYPGTGDGRFAAARNVSSGWRGLTAIVGPGDVTGDRRADLLGRDSAGRLYVWPGTGTGTFGVPRAVSGGWNAFPTLVAPGDVTQDGRADLLGRDTSGRLWRWDGNGNGTFRAPQLVSSGWGRYGLVTGGPDYAGDPYPDLTGLDASNRLTRWKGDEGGRFLAPTTSRPVH